MIYGDASKLEWGFTGEQAIMPSIYGVWFVYRPTSDADFRKRAKVHLDKMDRPLLQARRVVINSALHTYGIDIQVARDASDDEWADAYLALYRVGLLTLCYNPENREDFRLFVNPRELARAKMR